MTPHQPDDVVVAVRLADLGPVARFIGDVCRGYAEFQRLPHAEIAALPGGVARGILIIERAVNNLCGIKPPAGRHPDAQEDSGG